MPVVQRHLGRRPHDDEHALPLDPEIVQHGWVRSESVEVVLLLQPGIATHLRTHELRGGRGAIVGWRRERRRASLCDSRARAVSARTRSRRRTTTGLRANARPSAARARHARARCRTFARARSAAERGADLPSSEPCPTAPAPPCPGPTTSCSIPWSDSSSIVWANSRVVTSTSCPRACRRSTSGRKNGTCGEFETSIQTRTAGP